VAATRAWTKGGGLPMSRTAFRESGAGRQPLLAQIGVF
jgi:hypothetical protein